MAKRALTFAILAVAAAVFTIVTIRQRALAGRLRAEFADLRHREGLTEQLREENARLRSGEIQPEELQRLRLEQTEAGRLRLRIAALRKAAAPAEITASVMPARDWKPAGRASPKAAFESVLWTATHQEVENLAALLSFDPKARATVAAVFGQLPQDTRLQYGNPEKVVATMLAASIPTNLSAMETLSANQGPDSADLLMRVDRSDGTHKDTFFRFQRNDEGWQLIVPSNVLSGYAKQLGMSAPAP